MNISLTGEQEALIKSHAEAHGFASIEEAVQDLLAEKLAELDLAGDDLAWAKPLVDEGLAQLERGQFMTLEEHEARNRARLAALRK